MRRGRQSQPATTITALHCACDSTALTFPSSAFWGGDCRFWRSGRGQSEVDCNVRIVHSSVQKLRCWALSYF
eukprot:8705-Eustigmatos_ZCMA.PRE.1